MQQATELKAEKKNRLILFVVFQIINQTVHRAFLNEQRENKHKMYADYCLLGRYAVHFCGNITRRSFILNTETAVSNFLSD
jgi:hypothetical protein